MMTCIRAFGRAAAVDLTAILIVRPGQSTVGNSRCCMAVPAIQVCLQSRSRVNRRFREENNRSGFAVARSPRRGALATPRARQRP
jgi:hypothetical protein